MLQRLGSRLWDFKVSLQFSGWLQYAPNAVLALGLLVIGAVGWALGVWPALTVWTPLVVGGLLTLNLVFDVLTVKMGVRPPERIPARRDDLDAFDLMRARVSCRSFQTRNLTPEHRAELMAHVAQQTEADALLGDRPIRFEYVAAPLTVWPVVGAHEFLIAIAPKTYDRGAIVDVGRSLQKVVVHATRMGVATCWIGPGADHESVLRHLGDRFDRERDHIICVCAVGYPSRFRPLAVRLIQRTQRRRLPLSELFFASSEMEEPLDTEAPPFDRFGRCYEVCQWSPSSYNGQTTRCAAVTDDSGGLVRFDFVAAPGSRYYAPVALGIWLANWEMGCEALGVPGAFERVASDADEGRLQVDASWVVDSAAFEAEGAQSAA